MKRRIALVLAILMCVQTVGCGLKEEKQSGVAETPLDVYVSQMIAGFEYGSVTAETVHNNKFYFCAADAEKQAAVRL